MLFKILKYIRIVSIQALKLSGSSRKTTTLGEIVNLMSLDAQRLQDAFTYSIMVVQVPLIIVLCMYFLWTLVGSAAFAGLAVMLVLLPVNGFFLNNQIIKWQVSYILYRII